MLRLGIHIAKENNTIVKRVGARIRTESTEFTHNWTKSGLPQATR
jgi:hypothetical protein